MHRRVVAHLRAPTLKTENLVKNSVALVKRRTRFTKVLFPLFPEFSAWGMVLVKRRVIRRAIVCFKGKVPE